MLSSAAFVLFSLLAVAPPEGQILQVAPLARGDQVLVSFKLTQEPTEVFAVSRDHFPDLIRECHEVTSILVHLMVDRARVFNAAVAGNVDVAEIARPFDTVSVCLSKGLGAPIGSVLVGEKELIARARRLRKAVGGGLRGLPRPHAGFGHRPGARGEQEPRAQGRPDRQLSNDSIRPTTQFAQATAHRPQAFRPRS